jgi:hypothetical protein
MPWDFAALYALAVIDAGLVGLNDATGRSALIRKKRFHRLAVLRGMALGHALLAVGAVVALLTEAAPHDQLHAACRGMLFVYAPYAALALLALLARALPSVDVRSMLVTLVLGPLMFARPALVLLGGAAGVLAAHSPAVRAAVAFDVLLMLAFKPLLALVPRPEAVPDAG